MAIMVCYHHIYQITRNQMTTETNAPAYVNQDRWNDVYGKDFIADIQNVAEAGVFDYSKLARYKQYVLDNVGNQNGLTLLDVGCGQGDISVGFAKAGARVSGIDLGPDLIELSKLVARKNGVDCKFTVGSATEMPYEDNSFDTIVGVAILHHLTESGVSACLADTNRILKPGGKAYFLEPIEDSRIFDALQSLIPLGKPDDPQYRPSILQRKAWKEFLAAEDDRTMTSAEFIRGGEHFDTVHIDYVEWSTRLARVLKGDGFYKALCQLDRLLTSPYSPLKRLSRFAFVTYTAHRV